MNVVVFFLNFVVSDMSLRCNQVFTIPVEVRQALVTMVMCQEPPRTTRTSLRTPRTFSLHTLLGLLEGLHQTLEPL